MGKRTASQFYIQNKWSAARLAGKNPDAEPRSALSPHYPPHREIRSSHHSWDFSRMGIAEGISAVGVGWVLDLYQILTSSCSPFPTQHFQSHSHGILEVPRLWIIPKLFRGEQGQQLLQGLLTTGLCIQPAAQGAAGSWDSGSWLGILMAPELRVCPWNVFDPKHLPLAAVKIHHSSPKTAGKGEEVL